MAREQLAKTLQDLDQLNLRDAAHEARKRLKKIRALLRLFRPDLGDVYKTENIRFRDIGRRLAPIRDATSLMESVDALEKSSGRDLEAVKQALNHRRESIEQQHGDVLPQVRRAVENALEDLDDWTQVDDAFPQGVRRSYRRGRKRLRDARQDPQPNCLHEWRKRAKYHRYHCRLLEAAWRGPLEAREQEAHHLTDLLGDCHDLSELRQVLCADPGCFGGQNRVNEILECARNREAELAALAFPLGSKLFAEKPKALTRRLTSYWSAT